MIIIFCLISDQTFIPHSLDESMGANHGGGLGGLCPPEILLWGLAMDPAPQKNQVLAPHFS